jgi:hypothetical protein
MILPPGVNKATGLRAALSSLRISRHNVVGVGDAENDHALFNECEAAVAVQNALPTLKDQADWVTSGREGVGVTELLERLLASDLAELEPHLARREIPLGNTADGALVSVHAYGRRVLVCGMSGSGKSTFATSFLEQLTERDYRFCIVDPEGDFPDVGTAIVAGDQKRGPTIDEVSSVLETSGGSVVANLMGLPLDGRPLLFAPLLARLLEARGHSGMPHWIVVDEAHHMLPKDELTLSESVVNLPPSTLLVTVHPDRLADSVLRSVDTLIVVGKNPSDAVETFARAIGVPAPPAIGDSPPFGTAILWRPQDAPADVVHFQPLLSKTEHHRHQRKYASGDMGEDNSFYFRGPAGELNLRARNLAQFLEIGSGVDDRTWSHHLAEHDYSRWVRDAIKDQALADAVLAIERDQTLSPSSSRQKIREAIERGYTLPA